MEIVEKQNILITAEPLIVDICCWLEVVAVEMFFFFYLSKKQITSIFQKSYF